MTDEHPNERLVTPSEDGEGFDRSLVSRRSMLGGSALLAGLLAYTSDPTDPQLPGRASGSAAGIARASDNPDEPLIILGPESDPVGYLFQDTAGGIILQDATSGNHFWYNESQGRWETDAELDVPSLSAEEVATSQGTVWNRTVNDPLQESPVLALPAAVSSVSTTTETNIGSVAGGADGSLTPDGATLYGRQIFRSGGAIDQDVTVRPQVYDITNDSLRILASLEVTVTAGDTLSAQDSGWQEITVGSGALQSAAFVGNAFLAALSQQTNGDSATPVLNTAWGVAFQWRLD